MELKFFTRSKKIWRPVAFSFQMEAIFSFLAKDSVKLTPK